MFLMFCFMQLIQVCATMLAMGTESVLLQMELTLTALVMLIILVYTVKLIYPLVVHQFA